MSFSDIAYEIVSSEEKFFITLITAAVVLVITVKSIARVLISVSRERSRREIAAFIAEGSIPPEQGERLMAAGNPRNIGCG
ncbi:MAG: hypothetical protein ACF8Q5_03355 [Phycisphaerales bacterium JB040]